MEEKVISDFRNYKCVEGRICSGPCAQGRPRGSRVST